MSTTPSLAALQNTLDTHGFAAALEMLNLRVPHRYTVVYRFDGEAFYNVAVVDKLKQPTPVLFHKVPFGESFCQYTVGEGEFKTEDSTQDCRLDGHLHQATVQSYIGLPLHTPSGDLYGTFCHLDLVPHGLSDSEYAFLQQATALLAQYLPLQHLPPTKQQAQV